MATKKKKAPAKKQVSHAKVVEQMYRDFLRLAGEVSHAKVPVKKIVVKKTPAKKKKTKFEKIESPRHVPVFKRLPIKTPPPRKTRQIPIGGIAHLVDRPQRAEPPPREQMPVSEHWSYFDRSTGEPVSPWELDVGDLGDEEEEDEGVPMRADPERMFADEDYSYEDIEADWGGYEHTDTGYADENA